MLEFAEGAVVSGTFVIIRARGGKLLLEPQREYDKIHEDRTELQLRAGRISDKLDRGFRIRDNSG